MSSYKINLVYPYRLVGAKLIFSPFHSGIQGKKGELDKVGLVVISEQIVKITMGSF